MDWRWWFVIIGCVIIIWGWRSPPDPGETERTP